MAGGNPLLNDFGKKNATTTAPGSYQDPRYSPEQLERMYSAPAAGPAQTGRMSYDDVVVRTSLVLGCVVVAAAAGWFLPVLALPGALVGLVLGLIVAWDWVARESRRTEREQQDAAGSEAPHD